MKLLQRLKQWWNPPTVVTVRRHGRSRRGVGERPWTGADSLTAMNIRHHLQYGPMTRQQLNDVLDVTTASIHLPQMVKRGEVRKLNGRPARYELAR